MFLFIVSVIGLAGCQKNLLGPTGNFVPVGYRIPLVEGERASGNWQTRDLMMRYNALRTGDALEISGDLRFSTAVTYSFRSVRSFHLRAYLLNNDGIVLGTGGILIIPQGDSDDEYPFHTTIPLLPGTTFMALGYTGQAHGSDDDGGTDTPLWEIPTR